MAGVMLATALDMEPGHRFAVHAGGPVVSWLGVEPVASRFAGKRRVRVLVKPGPSFVTDADAKFVVVARG